MKGKIGSFIAGALTMAVISGTTVSALAADGALTLTVNPIKVMVNGEVFQPKDANGNDVMVFTSDGTTYAPLRALAEAYGLEVGYDAANNIATVTAPASKVETPDFSSQWTITEKPVTNYGDEKIFNVNFSGSLSDSEFKTWWKSFDSDYIKSCVEQIAAEIQSENSENIITAYFNFGSHLLVTVHTTSSFTGSDFTGANVWIK